MNDALRKALWFLSTNQQPDGSFLSDSSPQLTPFASRYSYRTTFTPALMVAALSDIPQTLEIRQKLADFLLTQKSAQWSFNYWAQPSAEHTAMPYPDDLDDTFCALSSLWLHDSALINEEALAHITKLLIATESTVGGPYRTWLVSKQSPAVWKDTDVAVNANVAYFLRLAVQPLPNLTTFMEAAIAQRAFDSPYYPDFYPIVYYLSRAYSGDAGHNVAQFLYEHQHKDGHWETPLHTALAVSALRNLRQSVPAAARRYILRTQQPDGSWPAEAFSVDPKRNGRVHYGGSAALTTAFALEALWQKPRIQKRQTRRRLSTYSATITKRAVHECRDSTPPIRTPLLTTLKHAASGKNGKEIIELADQFYRALRRPTALQPAIIDNLALANLYGWTAYTLYDDVLDGDADPTVLPAANVAMRRSLHCFTEALPGRTDFQAHVRNTFDAMDTANAWEVTRCRSVVQNQNIIIGPLPTYGKRQQLAARSIGHTLAPLGILAAMGVSPRAPQSQKLQATLTHYLIAKQLNDDAHDWEEDLRAGHMTYVVTHVLRSLDVAAGSHNLDQLVMQAAPQFWHRSLPQICKTISLHIGQSRHALADSELLVPDNIIVTLLDNLDRVMADTRATITQAESFLKAYRS